jgi:protein-arginine kinase activator protein McsA
VIPLCQDCGENPAVVFITQMNDEQNRKLRFCEACARQKALGEGWLQLIEEWSDEANLPDEVRAALEEVPLEQILLELFETDFDDSHSQNVTDPFDDDLESQEADSPLSAEFFETTSSQGALRCPSCNTTWDKLKADGRAGCPACYNAFRAELGEVMAQVQRGGSHVGKMPRAAQKRARRGDHLRARRAHQLELLQNRLKDAVASEKYEEAAQLRDKIRAISSGE